MNKYLSDAEVEKLFGKIEYSISNDTGGIELKDYLPGVTHFNFPDFSLPTYGGMQAFRCACHELIIPQLKNAFKEIVSRGLIDDIVFWGGCYNLRLIRGSTTRLSRHSWGIAFDINPEQNPIGATPAAAGEYGSVLRLVPIFEKWGFYWGGNFPRPDGMHFEACRIVGADDVEDSQKAWVEMPTLIDLIKGIDDIISSLNWLKSEIAKRKELT